MSYRAMGSPGHHMFDNVFAEPSLVDPAEIVAAVSPAGFSFLPVTAEHAARIAQLPPLHKDPVDRMLVAQASVEPMILLTNDAAPISYGTFVQIA